MGLISKTALLATGYVLGARAGTARYQQIVSAARTIANRPELQPYLGALTSRTTAPSEAPAAAHRETPAPPPPTPPAANTTTTSVTTPTGTGSARPTTPGLPAVALDAPPTVTAGAAPKVTVTGQGNPGRSRRSSRDR